MKALLICLSPEECYNLFNGNLSVLVRKKFPKDYVGWVYIYCTKNGYLHLENNGTWTYTRNQKYTYVRTGKVVARFWCDKVEEIQYSHEKRQYFSESLVEKDLLLKSCLTDVELFQYLLFRKVGYVIHITRLEIFDRPKEISEFGNLCTSNCEKCKYNNEYDICNHAYKPLTRAPKTYCYIFI